MEEIGLNITGRRMCETIARANILVKSDGTSPTPEEIWKYSPAGELFEIPGWYMAALIALDEPMPEPFKSWMEEIRQLYQ